MLSKIFKAWSDSYRVVENHRAVRRTAERLVWSGRDAVETRFGTRQLAPATSWL